MDAIVEALKASGREMNGREIMAAAGVNRWSLYAKLARLERAGLIVGRTPDEGKGLLRSMRVYRVAT